VRARLAPRLRGECRTLIQDRQVAQELARTALPGMQLCERAARRGIDLERAAYRHQQLFVQHTGRAIAHDIERSLHRVSRYRHAAGHGLEHHDTKGIRAAGKHQHIGACQVLRELRAEAITQKYRIRVAPLQVNERRTVAHDDFGARRAQLEERVDVLLDRDASGVQHDRTRPARRGCLPRPRIGSKHRGIHTARPGHQVLETACLQACAHAFRTDQGAHRRSMKPTQISVAEAGRNAPALVRVVGKLRVIGARERQAVAQAIGACGQSQRALGRNVDRLGCEVLQLRAHCASGTERQADLGIAGTGHGCEAGGTDKQHLVPEAPCGLGGLLERRDHPIDLRTPGVRHNGDSH